ncbi:MAG: hypothetical protein HQK53_16375, partial [Oligoflexia bacterium]|nr:hypothetical protein [Oligoflexia bacterium]
MGSNLDQCSDVVVVEQGSVRVDLLGGTLDLDPISLIVPQVVTVNLATSLMVRVKIQKSELSSAADDVVNSVIFRSRDYCQDAKLVAEDFTSKDVLFHQREWGVLNFPLQILLEFPYESLRGLSIEVDSDIPTGSGLGGSSAMGVTLYRALAKVTGRRVSPLQVINTVKGVESRILRAGPAGYQDYYPAIYGGILALLPRPGEIKLEQLFTPSLQHFLQSHLTLIYCGKSRYSGTNNWEIYKAFFDGNDQIREKLEAIARTSYSGLQAIRASKYDQLLSCIAEEGEIRKSLAPAIVIDEVADFYGVLRSRSKGILGMKVCGAGGGGCFLLLHYEGMRDEILQQLQLPEFSFMRQLDFSILPPLP